MPSAALSAPFLLAFVLFLSATAKLRDRGASERAFDELRVPAVLANPLFRRALPWIEFALGILLLAAPRPLNSFAAVGVLGLMGAYLVLVWRALRRPEPADCHCFGSLTSGRVTRLTLARNLLLVAVAVVAVIDSVAGTPLARVAAPDAVGWLAALLLTGGLAYTIFAERPARGASPGAIAGEAGPGGAEAGVPAMDGTAPAASEDDLDYVRLPIPFGTLLDAATPVTLLGLARERAVMLLWVSMTCGACRPVLEAAPAWRADLGDRIDVKAVFNSAADLAHAPASLAGCALLDPEGNAQRLFAFWGTPMAVLLGADGLLAGGPVVGPEAVIDLVAQVRTQLAEDAAEPEPA